MDEDKKAALRRVMTGIVQRRLEGSPENAAVDSADKRVDMLMDMMTCMFESGEGDEGLLEAMVNPDPVESVAKEILTLTACKRAYPKVQSALEGVVEMQEQSLGYSMRLWLCLPDGMERRGVSISFVSQMEFG
ncbi:hypothetical protein KIPB_008526, partial [Kipferlia bialata]|eukprot:g8526.t1